MNPIEASGKLTASAPEPGFDGIERDAQNLCGFFFAELEHDAEDEHITENWRKRFHVVLSHRQDLRSTEELLRSHGFGDQTVFQRDFVGFEWFQRSHGRAGEDTPPAHEGGVDNDSGEPGREFCAAFKVLQASKSAEKTVLQGVFGFFTIAGDSQGRMKKRFAMAMKESVQCLRLAALSCLHQELLAEIFGS